MMCSVEKQQKNTLDICAAFHKTEPRALCEPCLSPMCCILFFLLDMFDKTRSGRMDLFGFSALWDFMQRWRALFQQYDRDRSGSISGMELQQGIFCLWVDLRGWFTSRWNFTHFRLTILTDCAGWGLWWLFLIYITILELYGQKKFHPVPTRQKSCTQLKKVTTEENLICLHAACVVSSKCGSHWHWNVNTMILAKVSTVAF